MSDLWFTPKAVAVKPEDVQRQAADYLLTLPPFGLQPNGDVICRGCRHDIPEHADCRRRTYEGGFPEGDCWEAGVSEWHPNDALRGAVRPCPFCWALGKDLSTEEITPGTWAVCCTECGAQGPSNHLNEDESASEPNATAEEAVREWNTRA